MLGGALGWDGPASGFCDRLGEGIIGDEFPEVYFFAVEGGGYEPFPEGLAGFIDEAGGVSEI